MPSRELSKGTTNGLCDVIYRRGPQQTSGPQEWNAKKQHESEWADWGVGVKWLGGHTTDISSTPQQHKDSVKPVVMPGYDISMPHCYPKLQHARMPEDREQCEDWEAERPNRWRPMSQDRERFASHEAGRTVRSRLSCSITMSAPSLWLLHHHVCSFTVAAPSPCPLLHCGCSFTVAPPLL